jgi:Putative metal-binding motif
MAGQWHSSAVARLLPRLRVAVLALGLAASSCIYSPKLLDCKVRCGEGNSCPAKTTCENGFCRPDDATGFCACSPGEERACGGGQGECLPGVQRCGESKTWGACLGEIKASVELCDNKDNNCNGALDDMVSDAPPCGRTQGVCSGKVQQCVNGSYPGFCDDAEYGPDYQPTETRCDMKDNDCDGFVDGKAPVHLVNTTTSYALVGIDGGYALGWADDVGALTVLYARFYDEGLRPVGSLMPLGSSDAGVTLRGVSHGSRAYFSWEKDTNYDVHGAIVDRANPGVVTPLPGLPRADAMGGVKLGANAATLLGAYPVDAGVGILEWPMDGGSFNARIYVPPQADLTEVSYLNVSSGGSTIAYEIDFYSDLDAGTTDYDYILMRPDGFGYHVGPYVWYQSAFLDTVNNRTQMAYWGSCNYSIFFFNCVKSYLTANFGLWAMNSSNVDVRVLSDPTAITHAHAASTASDWVLAWVESTKIFIGTPVPAAKSIRFRNVDIDGGVATSVQIANSGGDFNAIVYSSNLSTGSLEGVLSCGP